MLMQSKTGKSMRKNYVKVTVLNIQGFKTGCATSTCNYGGEGLTNETDHFGTFMLRKNAWKAWVASYKCILK